MIDMKDSVDWTWSNFTWQNASITLGTKVSWRIYYNDTLGNENVTDIMTFTVGGHDVALTRISAWPTATPQGEPVYINVTVENQGGFAETFDVIVYADQWGTDAHFDIGSETVSLGIGESKLVEFVWDTTDVPCGTYWITAEAILPEDVDPQDNIARTKIGGICVPYSPQTADAVGLLIPFVSVILAVVLMGAAALGLFKLLMSVRLRWSSRTHTG